jgi:RHH-type proline utilization regulon transcriptional repressor/proline dehydrogenase/delta 1-pyrroline-5-carboxylate dehydrogenase
MLTGKLVRHARQKGPVSALTRLIGRAGRAVIRTGVAMAMRMMGEQFVTGRPSTQALNARRAGRRRASLFLRHARRSGD